MIDPQILKYLLVFVLGAMVGMAVIPVVITLTPITPPRPRKYPMPPREGCMRSGTCDGLHQWIRFPREWVCDWCGEFHSISTDENQS